LKLQNTEDIIKSLNLELCLSSPEECSTVNSCALIRLYPHTSFKTLASLSGESVA